MAAPSVAKHREIRLILSPLLASCLHRDPKPLRGTSRTSGAGSRAAPPLAPTIRLHSARRTATSPRPLGQNSCAAEQGSAAGDQHSDLNGIGYAAGFNSGQACPPQDQDSFYGGCVDWWGM